MSRQQPLGTVTAASAARIVAKKHVFKKLRQRVVDSEDLRLGFSQEALRKNEISPVNTNIIHDPEIGWIQEVLRTVRQVPETCSP